MEGEAKTYLLKPGHHSLISEFSFRLEALFWLTQEGWNFNL